MYYLFNLGICYIQFRHDFSLSLVNVLFNYLINYFNILLVNVLINIYLFNLGCVLWALGG